jgi:hypothetical protein
VTQQREDSAATRLRDSIAALAGGFDLLVCALPMVTLGLLFCLLNGTLDLLSWAVVPLGAGVALWGAMRLTRTDFNDAHFLRRAQWCVGLVVVLLALSPFLYWWRQMPKNFYFTLNTFLFVMALTALVFAVNRMSAHLSLRIGAPSGVSESKSVVWLVFVAWVLPLCILTGFLVRASFEYSEPMGWVLRKSLGDLNIGYPRWLLVVTAFAPVAFTCVALISTRRRVMEWAKLSLSKESSVPSRDASSIESKDSIQMTKEQP